MQPSKKITVSIKGMHCVSCAGKIEKTLKNHPKISEAFVNFASQKAQIKGDILLEELSSIIKSLGYEAVTSLNQLNYEKETKKRKCELFVAVGASLPLFFLAMIPGIELKWTAIVQWVLASVILFYPGRIFFISALKLALKKSTNMDTLIALGAGSAYIYSAIAFFYSEPLYFETAGFIVTFVLIGNYLEKRAQNRASDAITKLMEMKPQVGRVIKGQEEMIVPISEIEIGSELLVKPGEKIPLDGIVIEGTSSIDESVMTGESMPVYKEKGWVVYGATLNGSGALHIKVTKKDTETFFAQLIQLVDDAQNSKAPAQKLADTISSYFVPIICCIALFTFIGWLFSDDVALAIKYAVSVLIVACPCALGLATPIVIITAMGRGAKLGILIKNAEILQKLASVNLILLDKTGTITEGKPSITQCMQLGSTDIKTLVALAASGEKKSEHPLAHAFVEYARELSISLLPITKFKAHEGMGISFEGDGCRVLVGNESFMEENKISLEKARLKIEEYKKLPNTFVFLAINENLEGLFLALDKVKEKSFLALRKLKELHMRAVVITGDNPETARAVGDVLGIDEVIANVKPHEKLEKIKNFQMKGNIVAMVGDGINDAPALAAADVGIAVEGGSDVALHASDMTLLRGDISKIADSILLARKSFKIIKQNIFWAFFYNVVAIPSAVFGFVHPMIAALAMSFSSLTVVLNALRLNKG